MKLPERWQKAFELEWVHIIEDRLVGEKNTCCEALKSHNIYFTSNLIGRKLLKRNRSFKSQPFLMLLTFPIVRTFVLVERGILLNTINKEMKQDLL